MLSSVEGYRKQQLPKAAATRNTGNDPASIINVVHYLHKHCHGLIDHNAQLIRPVCFIGVNDTDIKYISDRHSSDARHRVVIPADYTTWVDCAAVICRGGLSSEQDRWLYDLCSLNTNGTWRNFCTIITVPVDAITNINDYDVYTACRRYVTRYADLLGQACGHRLDSEQIFPGGHLRSIFNSGDGEADWGSTGIYYSQDQRHMLILRIVVY